MTDETRGTMIGMGNAKPPVAVTGKIRDPRISLGRVFPIPTPTIGTAKAVNCPALTQQLLGPQAPDVARAR